MERGGSEPAKGGRTSEGENLLLKGFPLRVDATLDIVASRGAGMVYRVVSKTTGPCACEGSTPFLGTIEKECTWSPELAYAIGLIATDGNLSKDGRHISFRSSDLEQIKNFQRCLQLSNKIGTPSVAG